MDAGDCLQSRNTLMPLAMYEGNDHALPLRANLDFALSSFNRLIKQGSFETEIGESVPCEPIVVADMQGVKCMMGMTESCHSVWCRCRAIKGPQIDGEGHQHQYGDANDAPCKTHEEMLQCFDAIGCDFKCEEFLLACAHLSSGLIKGGRFTPFKCPDCGYAPSGAQAKADLKVFESLTDEEQKAKRKEHVAGGAHWNVELFMGPMTSGIGMERVGVDMLHLIYLNFFKHLFKYTVHESLPISKKKLVSKYLKAAGFYSYDAADDTDDPVKRWIGREVKRFLHEADMHLPFLLTLSSCETDVAPETEDMLNDDGDEEMDLSGDDFEPDETEVEQEEKEESLLERNASRWDRFLSWVRAIETTWESDTDEYRKARAVEWFNHSRACSRDLYELKPTLQSWVPHISCNIVPRQIVQLGDPSRRSADACESYGACCKKTVKYLTCRRRITATFSKGYIAQAFGRLAVRADLRHGEENAPYLMRQDAKLQGTGRASEARGSMEGPAHSVRIKIEQEAVSA